MFKSTGFLFLCLTLSILSSPTEQKSITVIKDTGISIRSENLSGNDNVVIGQAYKNYKYDVTDQRVAYYKIELPGNKKGWIYANTAKQWVKNIGDVVKINHEIGINVRKEAFNSASDLIGFAPNGYEYKILDTIYSHLKIKAPGNIEGWIYIGKPDDPWVSYNKETKKETFYATFTNGEINTNVSIDHENTDFNLENNQSSLRFLEGNESYVEATFYLEEINKFYLQLVHQTAGNSRQLNQHAKIKLSINNNEVLSSLNVNGSNFNKFIIAINDYLKKGKNSIKIEFLAGSKKHYWLKSFEVY